MNPVGPNSSFGHGSVLRPRDADGWVPGTAMAFGVHLMLVAALALGVRWKIDNPQVIEAEMWSEIPRAMAPADVPPPPPVEVQKPQERAPDPKEEEAEPPKETIPDLVVAAKPKKEEKKKPKKPVEVFETAPPKVAKKAEKKPEKKAPEPTVQAKAPAKNTEPPVKSKVTSPDGTAKAAAEREAQRNARLERMMNELGGLGTSQSSAGPSASYAGRLRARIKPRIVFTDMVSGNPAAVVEVRCGPDGRIIARKLVESSGIPRWDDAVIRAIDATEVLPPDENGRVPPVMQISFKPNDL
ncbi:MAG: cell envelope integrity protein TolA [Aquabacterium sp.]